MDSEITSTAMMKLLGIRESVLAELVERGVIIKAKTDRYLVLPSAPNYCRHLREEAAARGGQGASEARVRLGQAQATLAEVKAAKLAGELVAIDDVRATWSSKVKAVRIRLLAMPSRLRDLSARQNVVLAQEIRAALTDLADDSA